ncbi:hypothetical protein ACQKD2_19370, partial [Stenotrophomonas sp. NPDC077426]
RDASRQRAYQWLHSGHRSCHRPLHVSTRTRDAGFGCMAALDAERYLDALNISDQQQHRSAA